MEPIAGDGVEVVGADQQQGPVVLVVAADGPRGAAVELVVRYGDLAGGAPAGDDELAAGERELVVVDPDAVGAVQGDCIATPDVLRVEVGEVDVLDDDVAGAAAKAQALAANDSLGAHADDGLVALDVDGLARGVPVGARHPSARGACVGDVRLGLVAVIACVLQAALSACLALGLEEVKGAVQHDNTGLVVG